MRSFLLAMLIGALLMTQAIAQEGEGQKKETDKKPSQVEDKKGDKKDDKQVDPKKIDDKKKEEKGKEVKILAQGSWMAPPSPQAQGKGQEMVIRNTKDYALIFPIPPNAQIPADVIEKYASGIIKANLKMDSIDFEKQMVVVITSGIPFTPNQKITITKAEIKDGKLVIHYSVGTQEAGQPPSTGVIGLFEKFDGKVEFVGSGLKAEKRPDAVSPMPMPIPVPDKKPGVSPSPVPNPAPVPVRPKGSPAPPLPNPAPVPLPPQVDPAPPVPAQPVPPKPSPTPVSPASGN